MKFTRHKQILFYLLTIILSFLIIYLFVVTFFFLNIDKFFNVYKFKDIDALEFYKTRSKIMNHLRDPSRIVIDNNKNYYEYFFNKTTNGSKGTILFQGDSWFESINNSTESKNFLKKNLKDFTLYNAGATSYSPSLMHVQLKYLINTKKIKPDYLVIYVDQTDIGDENCRYKYLKKYDGNNNLISVPYEDYPISGRILNIDEMIKLNEILLKNSNNLSMSFNYTNYRILKMLVRIKKIFLIKIFNYPYIKACHFHKIVKSLEEPKSEEIIFFENSLREYFNSIKKIKYLKKIIVVTHPHKNHFINKNLKLNVSDIVNNLIKEYPQFEHLNFSNYVKDNKIFEINYENIWLSDEVHLVENAYTNYFLPNIIKFLNKL